jgi:hypothetical protein
VAEEEVAGPTAKVESCFSTEELEHEGQSTASPNLATSFSKLA